METPYRNPAPEEGAAKDKLAREREELGRQTRQAKDEATRKAGEAYEDLKAGTKRMANDSTAYLSKMVGEQKSGLVIKLEEYRDAANAAAGKLDSDDDQKAAERVRQVAGGIGKIASYLRESEPSRLFSDAGALARKRPEIVFGSMFLAGLGIARFMKASRPEGPAEPARNNFKPASGTSLAGSTMRDPVRPFAAPIPATGSTFPTTTAPGHHHE